MFKHLKIKKLLSIYLDGEISSRQREQVDAHLKKCLSCRRHLEDLRKLSGVMDKWQDEDMSLDLEQKIKNDFLGEKYKGVVGMKSKTKMWVGLSSVALTALLVFVLVGQTYVKRGVQGRLRSGSDISVDDYSSEIGKTYYQYEPYYGGEILEEESRMRPEVSKFVPGRRNDKGNIIASDEAPRLGSKVGPYEGNVYAKKERGDFVDSEKRDSRIRQQDFDYQQQGSVVVIEPYLPAYADQEKVIRNADAELEVKNVQKTYDEVVKVIKEKGGYLSGANFHEAKTGKVTARIVLRVPKDKFEETLDQIRKLGDVKIFNIKSTDVSHQYKTLVTELNTIKVVYDKIVKKLQEKRTDIEGAMQLESELTPYLRRIEAIKSQLAKYDNLIAMPTITVNLYATSWDVMFKENLKEIARQLIALVSSTIRVLLRVLPALLGIFILAIAIYAIIIAVIKGIKKAFKKKSE